MTRLDQIMINGNSCVSSDSHNIKKNNIGGSNKPRKFFVIEYPLGDKRFLINRETNKYYNTLKSNGTLEHDAIQHAIDQKELFLYSLGLVKRNSQTKTNHDASNNTESCPKSQQSIQEFGERRNNGRF